MRQRQVSVAILALLILIMAAAVPVYSQFKVLYNFGASGGTADPCQPINSGIIAQGRDGNLYSTAPSCGSSDYGAVFKVTPSGSFAVTYEMPGDPGAPFSWLTLGTDGNFYGTTRGGGTAGDGILFKITPTGSLTVLHSFTGGSDGYTSDAPPIQGTDGNFYGISRRGGSPACGNGCGTVHKMTPAGTFTSLYEFDYTHGEYPWAALVQGTDGGFYGTTAGGGRAARAPAAWYSRLPLRASLPCFTTSVLNPAVPMGSPPRVL